MKQNEVVLKEADVCIMKHENKYYIRISKVTYQTNKDGITGNSFTDSTFISITRSEAKVAALKMGIDIIGEAAPKFKQSELEGF